MRKEIPPPQDDISLTKVKKSFLNLPVRPVIEIEIPSPKVETSSNLSAKQSILKLPDRTVIGKKSALSDIEIKKDVVLPPETFEIDTDLKTTPIVKKTNRKKVLYLGAEGFLGGFIIIFGIINTGGFYQIASVFEGSIAKVFSIYQIGYIFMTLGMIIIYDSVKRV